MDVLRPPAIVMIAPRICSRPNGNEAVAAILIGEGLSHSREVWIQWCVVLVVLVEIAPGRIGLPHFDQRIADRTAIFIQDAPGDQDSFAERLAFALTR